jgi:DNA-binding SARP family transcriptional activator/tetratricopeptide (TPR) repeat protein
MAVELWILGSLEVRYAGKPVDVGGPRQRRVLAVLATEPGRVVPIERLVDAVWDGEPPRTARRQVQNAVSLLRQTAIGEVLAAQGPGYLLQVSPGQVDAHRFEEHLTRAGEARAARDLAGAAEELRAGLALWRGPALAGVGGRVAGAAGARLEERRLSAIASWAEICLELGWHAKIVDELVAVVERHPLREPLAVLLILALYRSGRAAESLVWYHRVRRALAEELGVEPGTELRRLFERVLAADPTLDRSPAMRARSDLPRDVAHFTGRAAELDRLVSVVDGRGTFVIQAIDGMAGVGKTALAVHAAHLLASRFPHGRLFVDLHGHTAGREPLTADAALDLLLRAVGVADGSIPKATDEKAALWRAEVADRRVLVVLDNAHSTAQVLPLLPGSPGCAVLVTSRRRLVGLDGAEVLSLDPLPEPDAIALFGMVAGGDRTRGEPAAVAEVVQLCGHLPLAIGITAARLRSRPIWTVMHLAARLHDERGRPTLLDAEDRSVTAAFDLSYVDLMAEQQRLFLLLGLHPGTDIDAYAAAALAGLPAAVAGRLLDTLCDVHLLIEHQLGRYRFHDLVRDFARARADTDLDEPGRDAARDQLLDYYLYVTELASHRLTPARRQLGPDPVRPPTDVPAMSQLAESLSWFQAEHNNLPAIARVAAAHSTNDRGWQIPRNIAGYLWRHGYYSTGAEVLQAAVAACRPGSYPGARTVCLSNLALMYLGSGEYQLALEYLGQSVTEAHGSGDRVGESSSLTQMAELSTHLGWHTEALDQASRAVQIYRAEVNPNREGVALSILIDVFTRMGRPSDAADALVRGAALLDSLDHERDKATLSSRMGVAYSQLGAHDTALELLTRSVEIARRANERPTEGAHLRRLAQALRRSGQLQQAFDRAREALAILQPVADPADLTEIHNALGAIHHDLRRHDEALTHYRQALATARKVGYRLGEANALNGIGHALDVLGDHDGARAYRRQALDNFAALGVPDTAEVRALLT